MSARLRAFARLGDGVFDLCVIGAGVLGSRIAYEAALDGLRVALVDAGDIAGATSSASSKLVRGGVRDLRDWQLGVAAERLRERRSLERDVAPGLLRRMPLLVSVERRRGASAVGMRAAVIAYAALDRWRAPRSRAVDHAEARRRVPALRDRSLGACFLLEETQVDDARLTVATALAAADAGAVVMNHARVGAIDFATEEVRATVRGPEGELTLRARSVVSATGPWLDALRRLEDPAAASVTRLSKCVHLALAYPDDEPPWDAALSVETDDAHERFAIPWQGGILIGPSEAPYEEAPGALVATEADVELVLGHAARLLPSSFARRDRVRATSVALRVLPRDARTSARPDAVSVVGARGVVSVAGGTLITHRRQAIEALALLPPRVRPRRREPSDATIVGHGPLSSKAPVSPGTLAHLASVYGDRTEEVLAIASTDPSAFDRIHPDAPDVWAQVRYAISNEYAMTVDDVIDRRTSLRWRGLANEEIREKIARMLLPRLVPS